jgi:uncharacterized protein (TIGR02217 family)
VRGFHYVSFPAELAPGIRGGPEFRTQITELASGHELRNSPWAGSRRRWEVGTALRDLAELRVLMAFFEARRGPLHGFLFRDPFDHSSAAPGQRPGPDDVRLGTGDGTRTRFALLNGEGVSARPILTPVAASVQVSVDGQPRRQGWTLAAGGVQFERPPAAGAEVRAGFLFDVPVRFEQDRLDGLIDAFGAGRVVSLGLVELLEIS